VNEETIGGNGTVYSARIRTRATLRNKDRGSIPKIVGLLRPRSRYVCDRALRRLPASCRLTRSLVSRSLARSYSNRTSATRHTLAIVYLPRLRFADFVEKMKHGWQSDSFPFGSSFFVERLFASSSPPRAGARNRSIGEAELNRTRYESSDYPSEQDH
jgi:hypothetical protein